MKLFASDKEKRAAEIVRLIREDERDNHFGNRASEAIPGPETLDMGGQFLTNRERIEGSKIFWISKHMPKGAHLHLHFNAELQPEILLREARDVPNMYIRSTQPLLTEADLVETEMVFNVIPDDTVSSNVFLRTYNPEWKAPGSQPWMRWSDFREEFDLRYHYLVAEDIAKQKVMAQQNCVQKNGADEIDTDEDPHIDLQSAEVWLKHKMVLSEAEAYGISQTVNG
jgi:adenosine deaminase CECR1